VPRDFDALEKRRFEFVRWYELGETPAAIARRLKTGYTSVYRWLKEYRSGGKDALRKAGRAGRKPLLSGKQLQQLEKLLVEGPERLGYETPLWTCPRVAHLIEQEFGVRYHEGHVWKLLVRLGWTPQRPMGRARNATRDRSPTGKRTFGRALKKSPERGPHAAVCRRERPQPAAASRAHLGAAGANSSAAILL
jgi:transposase